MKRPGNAGRAPEQCSYREKPQRHDEYGTC